MWVTPTGLISKVAVRRINPRELQQLRRALEYVKPLTRPAPLHVMNPVMQDLVINTREPLSNVKMHLFDATGKEVWAQHLEQSGPRMEYPLGAIPPSAYLLAVEWQGGSMQTLINKIE